jgi:hypothetical protein
MDAEKNDQVSVKQEGNVNKDTEEIDTSPTKEQTDNSAKGQKSTIKCDKMIRYPVLSCHIFSCCCPHYVAGLATYYLSRFYQAMEILSYIWFA